MRGHALAEKKSLELHRWFAERLEPALVEAATAQLERWAKSGALAVSYVERWRAWLALPKVQLAARLVEDSEEAMAMRQVTPFAGLIDPRTRWQLWERAERDA